MLSAQWEKLAIQRAAVLTGFQNAANTESERDDIRLPFSHPQNLIILTPPDEDKNRNIIPDLWKHVQQILTSCGHAEYIVSRLSRQNRYLLECILDHLDTPRPFLIDKRKRVRPVSISLPKHIFKGLLVDGHLYKCKKKADKSATSAEPNTDNIDGITDNNNNNNNQDNNKAEEVDMYCYEICDVLAANGKCMTSEDFFSRMAPIVELCLPESPFPACQDSPFEICATENPDEWLPSPFQPIHLFLKPFFMLDQMYKLLEQRSYVDIVLQPVQSGWAPGHKCGIYKLEAAPRIDFRLNKINGRYGLEVRTIHTEPSKRTLEAVASLDCVDLLPKDIALCAEKIDHKIIIECEGVRSGPSSISWIFKRLRVQRQVPNRRQTFDNAVRAILHDFIPINLAKHMQTTL